MTWVRLEYEPQHNHCACWYSEQRAVCCLCGNVRGTLIQFDDCYHCGEPIRREPGGMWEHAVTLAEDEDDNHVAEPEPEETYSVVSRQPVLPQPAASLFDPAVPGGPGSKTQRLAFGTVPITPRDEFL